MSACRLYELAQALDEPVQYFFDGISAEDEEVLREDIAEDLHSSPFLGFVSSGQGIHFNSVFLQIGDRTMRRDVMAMIERIERVSGGWAGHFPLTLSWLVGLYIVPQANNECVMSVENNYVFTSESVSEGHPDKVCDRISDAILDAFLAREPEARVAVETLATTNLIVLAGEVRPAGLVSDMEIEEIARAAVRDIGYEQDGFHWRDAEVQVRIHAQSEHIAQGVDQDGAGDQGIMFGYACRETRELMPAPIAYSHRILADMAEARRLGSLAGFGPDSKSQISLAYENGRPVTATSVVVSTQHDAAQTQDDVRGLVRPFVENVLPDGWMCDDDQFFVNPTGTFVIGGPDGDAGLTGRKIIVDTYGGAAPHGGGAFSGKDPTKVDRSAAYAARYLAKNVVAAELAERCTIQLSYAIGVARPLSVYIDTHGTSKVDTNRLASVLQAEMDLSPRGIREHLGLNRPIYARTAAYGHFGRAPEDDGGFSWERTDLVDAITNAL